MNTSAAKGEIDLTKGKYTLLYLRKEDLFLIKDWRNTQIDILRQKEILTDVDQERYYREVIKPSRAEAYPKLILLSYLKDGECVGYGGLVNIDWDASQAEVSFLMNPIYAENIKEYQVAFGVFLELIKRWAFSELNLKGLYTETYEIRPLHLALLEDHGFVLEKKLVDKVKVGSKLVNSLIHVCHFA